MGFSQGAQTALKKPEKADSGQENNERTVCVVVGSEKSGETFTTLCYPTNEKPVEVGILGTDGPESEASLVIVAYEGGGAFSIRSSTGSKISICGGKPLEPFVIE